MTLKNGKFIVTKSNLNHEYHGTDVATFKHYPENLRIPPEKLPEVEKMIALGVNKQKLKADLEADGKLIVPLKVLHNIQTAMNKRNESVYSGDDELQRLLKKLQEIPNAKVRVVTSDTDELIGKFRKYCHWWQL